jgi:hypothetical protein
MTPAKLPLSYSQAVTLSSLLDRELGSIAKGLEECLDGRTPACERALQHRQCDVVAIARALLELAESEGILLCKFENMPRE